MDSSEAVRHTAGRLMDMVGLEAGHTAIDLGCGTGWYAFAAGRRAGPDGRVVAIDTEESKLRRLREDARAQSMHQVYALRADIGEGLPLAARCADVVLAYDVLQFLHQTQRRRLYADIGRALKRTGTLSIHVRHLGDDPLARLLRGYTHDDIRKEAERHGFGYVGEYRGRLWHGGGLVDGLSLSFRCT